MKGEVTAVGVDPASASSSVSAGTRSALGAVGVGAVAMLALPAIADRLEAAVAVHIPATGSVGGDDPLEALADAPAWFPATEVLLAVPPAEDSYRLELRLLARERALTPVAVTQAIVPSRVESGRPAEAGVAQ